jgi:hypothetical protein
VKIQHHRLGFYTANKSRKGTEPRGMSNLSIWARLPPHFDGSLPKTILQGFAMFNVAHAYNAFLLHLNIHCINLLSLEPRRDVHDGPLFWIGSNVKR